MTETKNKTFPFKPIILASAILASTYLGNKYQPFSKLEKQAFYHNSSIEDGFYQNPQNLNIATTRNSKNRIEVYLVDKISQDSLAIQQNMHVGTNGENIDEFLDSRKNNIENWWKRQSSDSTTFIYKLKDIFD